MDGVEEEGLLYMHAKAELARSVGPPDEMATVLVGQIPRKRLAAIKGRRDWSNNSNTKQRASERMPHGLA